MRFRFNGRTIFQTKTTLRPDLVDRFAAFNETYELMNQDEMLQSLSVLLADTIESFPLRTRVRIKVKMFFVRWRLWLLYYIKGEV